MDNEMIVPFQVFQAHCGERNFVYAGKPGYFFINCGIERNKKCNIKYCPIWNSDRVKPVDLSLRDINLKLRQGPKKKPLAYGREKP